MATAVETLSAIAALIALALFCAVWLCPERMDEPYREWTLRRRRRDAPDPRG